MTKLNTIKIRNKLSFRQQYDIDNKIHYLAVKTHACIIFEWNNFLRRQLNYEEEYGNNNNTEREEMVTQYNNNNKSNVDSSKIYY